VNGVEVTNTAAVTPIPTSTENLGIGRHALFTTRNFDGLIDEVSIYNRALSAGEIATIHAAGSAGKCDPRPKLNIAALPGAVRLTWTTNATGYLLETNSALALPAGWGVLTSNYSVLNTNFAVTNSVGGATRFYRLHKP
jgi:Concanavalin A-like lectin/glucanases superfamily